MRTPTHLTPADVEDAAAGLVHDALDEWEHEQRLARLADRLVLVLAAAAVITFLLAAIFLGY